MAVGYRSSSRTGQTDALVAVIDVPVPAGAANLDIAVVAIERWNANNPAITPPAGFTQFIDLTDTGGEKLHCWWKRLTGADTGNYTFSWSGSQWSLGHCILITGAKTTGDPIGANFNTAGPATNTTEPTTSVTVSYQPFLVHFIANENVAAQTTPPTSFTNVQDSDYMHTNYRIPGSTGTFSASGGVLGASTLQFGALIAVEPAGAAAATRPIPHISPYSSFH
jgi:hypothetical protein